MPKSSAAKAAPSTTIPVGPAYDLDERAIAELVPYAKNARTHSDEQVRAIAASMQEFGWTSRVLIDAENDEMIAGHGRVLAAEYLGLVTAPVMVARGWSEAQKQAYRIADNALALGSDWDEDVLKAELASLRDGGEIDLSLLGFDAGDLDKMLSIEEAPEEFPSHDETIETEHVCPKCSYRWSGGQTS